MRRIGLGAFLFLVVLGVWAASAQRAACAENRTAVLRIEGMTCPSCTFAVKAALKKVEGVRDARVSFREKRAVVTYDPERTSEEALVKAVESTGFRAAPVPEEGGGSP
ncbi:MAG: heavy-metal-associated domain-containing protein [Deltaproteobacteria bacterium]|nr:heavy-metal-associated domain-containing protein [Deltaproteobacteria bacterium]